MKNLEKTYYPRGSGKGSYNAVDGVSLNICAGETLGLVGESGSGKSTLGRLIIRLLAPTSGQILFKGQDLAKIGKSELKRIRRTLQIIFQSPHTALNPYLHILDSVCEPMRLFGLGNSKEERRQLAVGLLTKVGLDAQYLYRYPHELSGGQIQRVALARVLSLKPQFIVADEPTSMLDLSVQAQILKLLQDLKKTQAFACLFISHDLDVVHFMSDRIAVMYRGQIVEIGPADDVLKDPRHPYTAMLVDLFSGPKSRLGFPGRRSDQYLPGTGCPYRGSCPRADKRCSARPDLTAAAAGHFVACFRA